MKHYLLSAFLILSTLIGLISCSKESSSNSSYLGKWKLSGVMGHGALTEITSMTIKESMAGVISSISQDRDFCRGFIKQKRLTCVKRFIFVTPTELSLGILG